MSQVYLGEVRDGVVVFEGSPPKLPNGTRVRVEAVAGRCTEEEMKQDLQALSDLLMSVAGKAEGLPPDLADQHDHYLHGTPKR